MPTALRIPQAKTFFPDPSGLNSKMRARSDSDESSELFERDPMETYILLPSGAKTMSRVQCPPPRSKPPPESSAPSFPAGPRACMSPFRYGKRTTPFVRSEEHTSELQSRFDLVCRLLL